MRTKHLIWCLTAVSVLTAGSVTVVRARAEKHASHAIVRGPLPGAVRQATERFRDANDAITVGYVQNGGRVSGSVLEPALHYFTRNDSRDVLARLDSVRPAPVSNSERGRILAMLPAEGHLRVLNTAQRKKVAAVRRVLELHQREAVYVIKVMNAIEVPQAAVALHARAVVLISERALDLLDTEELQALVAHEVGHEYLWGEYARARRDNDHSTLRRLELLCDGFAVVTLQRVGVNPKRLTSGLEKMGGYNRDRFGVAVHESNYPPVSERRRFVRRLVEWLGRSGSQ